ncbi:transposase [Streptosporangium violaceochromogenes]|nr:transposase [Streptosporangium violaceochromogenes]
MKIQRGMRYRLYPTPDQVATLDEQGHAARSLWNLLHDWWTWGGRNRRPTLKQADQAIRQARQDIDWLGALPAQASQQVLKNYARAWKNFFEGRAKPPTFKSRLRSRAAVDVPQGRDLDVTKLSRRWATVKIPKVGVVRLRLHRTLPGTVTGARLLREADGWHIVFRANWEQPDPAPHPGPSVGIDRGIAAPLALSDGTMIGHGPWLRPKEAERLLRLERRSARQRRTRQRGEPASKRLRRTYDAIAGLRARAARRRADWQHKTTRTLAGTYGLIGVEDLNIAAMTRSAKGTVEAPGRNVAQKAGLNRSIQGEAWGQLVEQLTYKTAERGGAVVRVPAPHTSQRCHACGFITPGSRESQARFACKNPQCGWGGNADVNAARNIHHAAKQAASTTAPGSGVAGRGALQPSGGAKKRQPKRKDPVP